MNEPSWVTLEFRVELLSAKPRLDEYLANQLPELSRMYLARRIREGHCRVSGVPQAAGFRLQGGERIELSVEAHARTAMTAEEIPLRIHFEDDSLLVVEKPAGMLVHPNKHERSGTLMNALTWHCNPGMRGKGGRGDGSRVIRPGLVHRLDRATSGLMLVAKNARSLQRLGNQFAARQVWKRYLAVVTGSVPEREFAVREPIGRDACRKPAWGVSETGKPAETKVEVISRRQSATLLELNPVTGRTNQLRIHCAWAGFPILGDDSYGGAPAARLFLHAREIGFRHPEGGEPLAFSTALPDEFAAVLDAQPLAISGCPGACGQA